MKKILALLLTVALVFACVACGTPKEIVKDKKFSLASHSNYVTIKTSVENMRTEFPEEYDEEEQRMKYHLSPKGTVVVEVIPIGEYETEFTDCVLNIAFDAGQLGKSFVEIALDKTGHGIAKVEMAGGGWLSKSKTYIPTPNVSVTVSEASGRVKTHIPYTPEEN